MCRQELGILTCLNNNVADKHVTPKPSLLHAHEMKHTSACLESNNLEGPLESGLESNNVHVWASQCNTACVKQMQHIDAWFPLSAEINYRSFSGRRSKCILYLGIECPSKCHRCGPLSEVNVCKYKVDSEMCQIVRTNLFESVSEQIVSNLF